MTQKERVSLIRSVSMRVSLRRMEHILRVEALAVKLARFWGISEEKANIAALLHDIAREEPLAALNALVEQSDDPWIHDLAHTPAPLVLHAPAGAVIARRDYGVSDPEILQAIAWHTTGAPHMDPLAMIIFLADYCEPGRHFQGVEKVRGLLYTSLEASMLQALAQTLAYVRLKSLPVDSHTAAAAAYFDRLVACTPSSASQP